MNTQVLIDSIMRQTTVLIAQLATVGGVRAPLSHVANQIFLDLARELEAQGVSRKVSADMFGMALRAYLKKLQRLSESSTDRGRSLWQAVFDFVSGRPVAARHEVLARFHHDDQVVVRGVLHDLTESGLLFATGSGPGTAYRALDEEEIGYLRGAEGGGADALVWVLIYREGPLGRADLLARGGVSEVELDACLARLQADGRIRQDASGCYAADGFYVSRDAEVGWEAALFDHYHALVKTICCRLSPDPELTLPEEAIGGSTYTFEVWPGHPHHDEVLATLREYRQRQSALRARVEAHNAAHGLRDPQRRVVTYAGQCVLSVTGEEDEEA